VTLREMVGHLADLVTSGAGRYHPASREPLRDEPPRLRHWPGSRACRAARSWGSALMFSV